MQDIIKMLYILVETEDTSSIALPLKTTNRIKFLSFTVSQSYIVFGASSGGLYVYDREAFTFKALVPSKEGPVTCVKISPDEKWFGFSTTRGVSCVLEHSGSNVNRRILSHIHEGRHVTALQWNNTSSQLYLGDNTGQISVISVASYLTPAVTLMQLDSGIVQLDTCSYMLLISTLTRSFLCDTFREQYRQIGSRLRDGEFGSCFYEIECHEPRIDPTHDIGSDQKDTHRHFSSLSDGEWLLADSNLKRIKLFCARPGLRLWEVRIDGSVMSTHQFKQLQHTPPVNVVRPPEVGFPREANKASEQNYLFQFSKLCKLLDKYLLTYDANGLFVLDPMTSEVILWTDQFKNVVDVNVVGEVIYLWMGDSRLHAVYITPIDKFLVCMYLQKKYLYCAKLCGAHAAMLKKLAHISTKLHLLVDLLQKITEEGTVSTLDEDIVRKISELLSEMSKTAQNQEQAQMLKSGIFVVGNAHLLAQKEEVWITSNISENSHSNDVADIFPDISRNQVSQLQQGCQNDKDMNGIFRKSILPSISSLSMLSEHSKYSDEDYDPFPDLPLSSLTSTETIMALKNLTVTVSGTITNGTKSLREKWHNLEGKLRGQEECGLGVEKSINRPNTNVSNLFGSIEGEDKTIVIQPHNKLLKLSTLSFMEKCHEIECYGSYSGKSLEQLQFEMLDSFVLLYEEYRKPCNEANRESGKEGSMGKWTSYRDIIPFPFEQYFEKQFVTTVGNQFQVCLKSGLLTKWISQSLSDCEVDYWAFPSHISNFYNVNSLLIDQTMGRFLKMCGGLLDSHSALQNLEDSGSVCQYFSWNVILDHFSKSSSTSSASNGEMSQWSLSCTLNAMLVFLQLGQVERCRNIGKHVPSKYMLWTIIKLKESSPCVQTAKLFLSYLEKEESLMTELEDAEVYYFTRQAFESFYEAKQNEQCTCGYPVTGLKYDKTFHRVGLSLLSRIYQTDGLSKAMQLCQKTGLLWHHLLVLRRNETIEEVLPLILHVSCEEELRNRCSELSLPSWDLLFRLRSTLEQRLCLNCNASFSGSSNLIPWMFLASLLLHETSVSFALALLSKHANSIPDGGIHLQFYEKCLLASLAENQSTELKRNLLEALTVDQEVPVLSPKLADKLGFLYCHGPHHWGLQLQLSTSLCLCCRLPLASSSGGSVITLQCRHTFHSVCLKQKFQNRCPGCT